MEAFLSATASPGPLSPFLFRLPNNGTGAGTASFFILLFFFLRFFFFLFLCRRFVMASAVRNPLGVLSDPPLLSETFTLFFDHPFGQ